MGNLCSYFCETKRCVHCGVPYEYYSTNEQRDRQSCRGDYPGLSTAGKRHNDGYHKFS